MTNVFKYLKNHKSIFIRLIIVFVMLIPLCIGTFICVKENKTYYARYNETSDLNYKVYLNDNTFFEEEYLGMSQSYVASLIKRIDAKFNYKLSLDENDVNYSYRYRIDGDLTISAPKSSNNLYKKTYELVPTRTVFVNSKASDVVIEETVSINYKEYNDIVTNFINEYGIHDIASSFKVNLYVDVIGSCEEFKEDGRTSSSLSMDIPLTTKTVDININTVSVKNDSIDNVMACKKVKNHNIITIPMIAISAITMIALSISVIIAIRKNRSEAQKYKLKVKRIVKNYRSYIQRIKGDFNIDESRVVYLEKFSDLLEIRDTIQSPILMKEYPEDSKTLFMIPSTQYLYMVEYKIEE